MPDTTTNASCLRRPRIINLVKSCRGSGCGKPSEIAAHEGSLCLTLSRCNPRSGGSLFLRI